MCNVRVSAIHLVIYVGSINLPFTKLALTTKFSDKQPNGAKIYYFLGGAMTMVAAAAVIAYRSLYINKHVN